MVLCKRYVIWVCDIVIHDSKISYCVYISIIWALFSYDIRGQVCRAREEHVAPTLVKRRSPSSNHNDDHNQSPLYILYYSLSPMPMWRLYELISCSDLFIYFFTVVMTMSYGMWWWWRGRDDQMYPNWLPSVKALLSIW